MATNLGMTRTKIRKSLGRMLGYNRDPSEWTTIQDNDCDAIIESGERGFYHPPPLPQEGKGHVWSWLMPVMELSVNEPFDDGTIEVASGVVTFTFTGGEVVPSWAAAGLLVADGTTYTVDTRDGDTQITLDDTSVDIDSGTSYQLKRLQYALTSGFGGFLEPHLNFSSDDQLDWPVKLTSMEKILEMRQLDRYSWTDQTYLAAVIQLSGPPDSTGQLFALEVWPPMPQNGTLLGRYLLDPGGIDSDDEYPMGGQPHGETLLASCLSAAELFMNDERGPHYARFMELLAFSVSLDRQVSTPKYFGKNIDRSQWKRSEHRLPHDGRNNVTYVGVPS